MIYVLAAIGLVTLVVLGWRAFAPDLRAPRTLAPDDDPEFLKTIGSDPSDPHSGGDD